VTTVSVCSAKGSPGATTLACAIGAVWPVEHRIVVAECDPSGGDIAARFNLSAKRGMASLVLEARRSTDRGLFDLDDHIQSLPGGLEVLAGPTGAAAANTVDAVLPEVLSRHYLSRRGSSRNDDGKSVLPDLVLDCGRIQPGAVGQSAAILASHHVLVVARPTVESVASARWIAEQLHHGAAGLVLVGNGLVDPSQAVDALALPLLAVIPEDRVAAAALRGEPVVLWRLARSALIGSVRDLVATLLSTRIDPGLSESHQATDQGSTDTPGRSAQPIRRSIRLAFRATHRRDQKANGESSPELERSLPPRLLVGGEDK
jgi:MinD-like ATPase involved in chromosome partitioning or flagellar assembly